MAEITTPRELFVHELGDILYVEQQLAQEVLPMLINEAQLDEFRKEHEELAAKVSPDLREDVHAGAVARTEHYEIAAYSALIEKARALGEQDAVTLFEENLKEERAALRNAEAIEKTLRDELKAAAS